MECRAWKHVSAALVCLALGAGSARAATPRQDRYVLWEVAPLGLDTGIARALEDMLQGELEKIFGEQLVDGRPWVDLDTREDVRRCDEPTVCVTEVVRAMGATRTLIGVVATLGDAYSLTLKLLDASTGRDVGRVQATLRGQRSEMLATLQKLIYELVDPGQLLGSLAVNLDLAGAEIYLDGKLVGTTPLAAPIADIPLGEHALKISGPIMQDYFAFVSIYPGKTTTVNVDAQRIEAVQATLQAEEVVPVYARWWFWPAVGGAVLAVAAGTVLALSGDTETTGQSAPEGTLGTIVIR